MEYHIYLLGFFVFFLNLLEACENSWARGRTQCPSSNHICLVKERIPLLIRLVLLIFKKQMEKLRHILLPQRTELE